MSNFEVTLSDGSTITVDAKDASEAAQKAQARVKQLAAARQKGEEGGFENFQRSFMNAITFGFGDEIAAGMRATLPTPTTSTAPTWSQRYEDELRLQRAQNQGYADTHPGWDTAARVGGGITSLGLLPNAVMRGGFGGSVAAGAGLGGVAGFGEGEGGFQNRLQNAGKGALLGGAAGAVLHPLAAGAGAVVRGLRETPLGRAVADSLPGVRGGGDRIVGAGAEARIADAVRRGGDTAATAEARLGELGPGAMPADINPMTQRLTGTAYISPGSASKTIDEAMNARARTIGNRFGDDITRAMGESDAAVIEAQRLRAQRAAEADEAFDAALGADVKLVTSPEMKQIMKEAPAIQRAMKAVRADAKDQGIKLTDAEVAHRVKRRLNLDAEAAFRSGRGVDKADVANLAERWRKALHDANPAIKEADRAYAAKSAELDALDLGRTIMKQGLGEAADAVSPAILNQKIAGFSQAEKEAFIKGAADTLKTQVQSGLRKARGLARALDENQLLRLKIEEAVGKDNARILYSGAGREKAFAATDKVVRGGSDTGRKILSALDEGAGFELPTSPSGVVTRLLKGLVDAYNKSRGGNEAVRARMAELLTSTDPKVRAQILEAIQRQAELQGRRGIVPRAGSVGLAQQQ